MCALRSEWGRRLLSRRPPCWSRVAPDRSVRRWSGDCWTPTWRRSGSSAATSSSRTTCGELWATPAFASTSATCATTTASTGPPEASTSCSTPPRSSRCRRASSFPLEAVQTNVLGSANVIEASNSNGVGKVVCLGTDKAVYPVNAMGMSKAMMEKVGAGIRPQQPDREDRRLDRPLRQRDVLARLGHPAVRRADQGRQIR